MNSIDKKSKEISVGISASSHPEFGERIYLALMKELNETPLGERIFQIIKKDSAFKDVVPPDLEERLLLLVVMRTIAGQRPEMIAKEVVEYVPELHLDDAVKLARNASKRTTIALKQARAEKYKRPFYSWWSCRDERVRPSHKNLHGVICCWAQPPCPEALNGESGTKCYHPGGTDFCRCEALSVVSIKDIEYPARVHVDGKILTVSSLEEFKKAIGFD